MTPGDHPKQGVNDGLDDLEPGFLLFTACARLRPLGLKPQAPRRTSCDRSSCTIFVASAG